MNESNGLALVARVAEAFAASDRERMEQLDRWIRQSEENPEVPDTCHLGHPLDGRRKRHDGRQGERFCLTCHRERSRIARRTILERPAVAPREDFACLRCETSPLSIGNTTGLCRVCVNEVGQKTRDHYRALHRERLANHRSKEAA